MTDDSPPASFRTSPLHDTHVVAGASFTDFAGWQMPVRYSSDLAEHHAVRTAAGMFDLSHMGEILIMGPQSGAFLDFALAGRLSTIVDGQAKYTLLLSETGGIIDDLVVYRTGEDRYLVVANASNSETVASELLRRSDGFDCVVEDESDDVALIALQGPRALEILLEVPEVHAPGLAELKYYRATAGTFGDRAMLVARTGYTGEDGFELYVSPEAVRQLWESIMETGAGSGLVPAGLASRDTLRLEAGMPLYGHELGLDVLPVQAGLGRVVVLAKSGDFVGRAALENAQTDDARVLVGIAADGRRAGRADYEIFADERGDSAVGVITSGALSPTLGHPIGMAYVDPGLAAVGTTVYIDVRGTRVPASVVPLPFYQRKA